MPRQVADGERYFCCGDVGCVAAGALVRGVRCDGVNRAGLGALFAVQNHRGAPEQARYWPRRHFFQSERIFFQPDRIFSHMTKISGGAAGRFCHMTGASCHMAEGLCHLRQRAVHMEKNVRGVTKSPCHVKKDAFLLDRDVFDVKKLPWNAVFGAFLGGAVKPLKPSAGEGSEGFRGASSRGGERFQPGAAIRLPGVGLSRRTRNAFPHRLSC